MPPKIGILMFSNTVRGRLSGAVCQGPSTRGRSPGAIWSRPPDGTQTASVAAIRKSWAIHPKGQYKWRMLPTFLLTLVGELGAVSLSTPWGPTKTLMWCLFLLQLIFCRSSVVKVSFWTLFENYLCIIYWGAHVVESHTLPLLHIMVLFSLHLLINRDT
jgi:hypothetical protein